MAEAVTEGALDTALAISAKAKELSPRMTGTLSRSISVSADELPNPDSAYQQAKTGKVEDKKKKIASKVYISASTPYAHRQHEDANLSHDGVGTYYTNGGKKEYIKQGGSKYLEKAFNEKIGLLDDMVKKRAKRKGL